MQVFEELAQLYSTIDSHYAALELRSEAMHPGQQGAVASRQRELNDHAYFLFIFTRLEDMVREESSKLIHHSQHHIKDWKQRRPWDLLPAQKDSDRMTFMERVALLIDKGSHHYQTIQKYYKLRNTIGHGGDFTTPVSIPTVVEDFTRFHGLINGV